MLDEVEFICDALYEEYVWLKIRGGRGREALFVCCVYMPSDSSGASVIDTSYTKLKKDVIYFKEKETVVLLGDFNARVGKAEDLDDVVGMFREETCNASCQRLLSLLNEVSGL